MRVFISWSGDDSRAVALALRDWLPDVINEIEPFVSTDIAAGERWGTRIARQLETADCGIICVTASNRDSRWLNFEAGALGKLFLESRVIPLAIGIDAAAVGFPIGQFQVKGATREGLLALVLDLNALAERKRDEASVRRVAGMTLGPVLSAITAASKNEPEPEPRPAEEMISELYAMVRGLAGQREAAAGRSEAPRASAMNWSAAFGGKHIPQNGPSDSKDFRSYWNQRVFEAMAEAGVADHLSYMTWNDRSGGLAIVLDTPSDKVTHAVEQAVAVAGFSHPYSISYEVE